MLTLVVDQPPDVASCESKCGEAVTAASPRNDMESKSMPITVGHLYREYERLLMAGLLRLDDVGCPR